MDAGNCALGFGAFASDAENKLGHHMEKVQVRSDCIYLLFDVGSVVVFYGRSLTFRFIGDLGFSS